MNNDTIKILKIKGYTMLIQDIQELTYKYNKLLNNEEITETTYEILYEQLTRFKNDIINYIDLVAND